MNVYIISGASKGLGQALSKQLHDQGGCVFGISRSKGETAGQFVECDLSDAGQVSTAIEKVFTAIEFGKTDAITLINNAADLSPITPIGKAIPEQIKKGLDINLIAPTILTSIFIQKTQAFQGRRRVVNVSSKAAIQVYFGLSLYCMAKAGLEQLSRCVALEQEGQENPAHIISLDPGPMNTPMQETIRSSDPDSFPYVDQFRKRYKNGELPAPEAIAEFVVDCINNDNLVSGGRYGFMDR